MLEPMLVETPRMFPAHCVDGSQGQPGEPVVDTGYEIFDQYRVYLSRRMLRDGTRLFPALVAELAAEVGWVGPDAHLEALAVKDARIAELEADLAELVPVRDFISRYGDRADDEPVRATGRKRAAS